MASQQPPQGPTGPQIRLQPGQQPTPEQIQQMQRQLAADAQKAGMSVPQYVERLKAQAIAQQQAAQQQQAQAQQQQQQPINPGPPKPEALAVANFLKSQDLKMRTCILNGQRKDMFKGRYTSGNSVNMWDVC
jgi:translocation protein SEC62